MQHSDREGIARSSGHVRSTSASTFSAIGFRGGFGVVELGACRDRVFQFHEPPVGQRDDRLSDAQFIL